METTSSDLNYIQEKATPQFLPPGFRFHPTDEELVDYLEKKVAYPVLSIPAIVDVDMNQSEPWEIPGRSKMGEKEWYFFTLRDKKYPTGMRTNRATKAGYWKGTGKDREVYSSRSNTVVGMKKTLVFYKGRAPKGAKTNWIIHEYRLEGAPANLHLHPHCKTCKDSEWVVCRVFHKMPGGKKSLLRDIVQNNFMDNVCDSQLFLPALHECPILSPLANNFPANHTSTRVQTDPASTFLKEDNTAALSDLMELENREIGCWTGLLRENALIKDSSSLGKQIPGLSRYNPSNLTLQAVNLEGRPVSDNNSDMGSSKRVEILHALPQAMTSCIISSNLESENHFKNVSTHFSHNPGNMKKPCKTEPYLEANETFQFFGNNLMPEKTVWMEGIADCEGSQALLQLSFPFNSSSSEINDISSITYRKGLISLTDDMDDCFWRSY